MGALHAGHLKLIEMAGRSNDLTICSIFVNPTQFNDKIDFEKYPVTLEEDIRLLLENHTDVVFVPGVGDIYQEGTANLPHFELGDLETKLEGAYRPGHFQGVCQVVNRLLGIVRPDRLYLGQKDYQQCMVISRLIELTGIPTEIVIVPTIREKNGLAMSSRNQRLSPEQRQQAAAIFASLKKIQADHAPGNLIPLKQNAIRELTSLGFRVDYVEIAGASDLEITDFWDGSKKLIALAAAYLGDVRLIDNLILE